MEDGVTVCNDLLLQLGVNGPREERVEAEQRIPDERSRSMADARSWPEGRRVQNPGLGNSVQDI